MSTEGARAKSVDTYIDAAPEYAQPICRKLRELAKKAGPDWVESIKWNSPSYTGRSLVCGFAAFKNHVSLYFHQGGLLADPGHILAHGQDNVAGRSVKFSSIDEIDGKKLLHLFTEAAVVDREQTTKPEPKKARPPLLVPADFTAALAKAPKAKAFFDSLSPSCRREYIEWITSAKRPETAARRMDSALVMLGKGERRNEKYQK